MVFFALLAAVVQWWAAPGTLFQDLGPIKASFKAENADMSKIIKLGGGLMLMIGMTMSGVKWNPTNGKMAGLGGFIAAILTAYSTFTADGGFVPKLLYVYAAIIFVGASHVFIFPSNPPLEKTPETKNNHGNWSDKIALGFIVIACLNFFYPAHLFQDLGPLKAQFSATTPDLSLMIKFIGGLFLTIGLTLSGVKWNPINGKMAGLGGFIAAGFTAFSTFKGDSDAFVPQMLYIYAFLLFAGSLHIFAFPSNPLPKKASDKKA